MILPPVLPYGPPDTVPNLHALAAAIRQLDARLTAVIEVLAAHDPDLLDRPGVVATLRSGELT